MKYGKVNYSSINLYYNFINNIKCLTNKIITKYTAYCINIKKYVRNICILIVFLFNITTIYVLRRYTRNNYIYGFD